MCPSTSWLTHLTVFVLIHLMTVPLCITIDCVCPAISWPADTFDKCVHLMTCRCPSISWPVDTFNSVCVHPSHDLQTLLTVFVFIHLMTSDTFDDVCIHLSHDLQTHLTVCLSISWPAHFWQFVFIHLMTCRHFWQCLCPSILWPADTFDSFCVHPSHDLQTLLTVFVSIHLMTCRHFWQFLCPSILWPADIFDSGFTSIHLMTFRLFFRWAFLSLDNTTFSFSIFYRLFPGYNLILMPLFCISGTMAKTRSPRVVSKFGHARESSRALVDDKEAKTAADQRARNKLTSQADPVSLTGH